MKYHVEFWSRLDITPGRLYPVSSDYPGSIFDDVGDRRHRSKIEFIYVVEL